MALLNFDVYMWEVWLKEWEHFKSKGPEDEGVNCWTSKGAVVYRFPSCLKILTTSWVLITSLGFLTDAMLQKQGKDGPLVMLEEAKTRTEERKQSRRWRATAQTSWITAENVCVIITVYLKVWNPANMFDTNTLSDVLHMWSDIICAILNLKADPQGAGGARS